VVVHLYFLFRNLLLPKSASSTICFNFNPHDPIFPSVILSSGKVGFPAPEFFTPVQDLSPGTSRAGRKVEFLTTFPARM
jgi:hypothetical protein